MCRHRPETIPTRSKPWKNSAQTDTSVYAKSIRLGASSFCTLDLLAVRRSPLISGISLIATGGSRRDDQLRSCCPSFVIGPKLAANAADAKFESERSKLNRSIQMPEILGHLQVDHRNMRQLLCVLEEELQAYDTRGSADFDLMHQVLEYTLHYPNLIHHPREEALFRRLLERDSASKTMVGDLTKEHEELARLTHRFAAALHNAAHDVELPRELFRKLADEYLARSRQHMDIEEQKLFPRLITVFSDEDWADLDGLAARGYDPLFGTTIEQYYKTLHQRILNSAV